MEIDSFFSEKSTLHYLTGPPRQAKNSTNKYLAIVTPETGVKYVQS